MSGRWQSASQRRHARTPWPVCSVDILPSLSKRLEQLDYQMCYSFTWIERERETTTTHFPAFGMYPRSLSCASMSPFIRDEKESKRAHALGSNGMWQSPTQREGARFSRLSRQLNKLGLAWLFPGSPDDCLSGCVTHRCCHPSRRYRRHRLPGTAHARNRKVFSLDAFVVFCDFRTIGNDANMTRSWPSRWAMMIVCWMRTECNYLIGR